LESQHGKYFRKLHRRKIKYDCWSPFSVLSPCGHVWLVILLAILVCRIFDLIES
jgi:hypothetical protein